MGLPANRTTSSKRDMRRSHHFLTAAQTIDCPKCGSPALPHTVCKNCGFYKGGEVVNVLVKLDKKEKKKREKELAQKEKEHKHEHGETSS